MNISWYFGEKDWDLNGNSAYIALTILMVGSYALFARGFEALANLFENRLLKIMVYLLVLYRGYEYLAKSEIAV